MSPSFLGACTWQSCRSVTMWQETRNGQILQVHMWLLGGKTLILLWGVRGGKKKCETQCYGLCTCLLFVGSPWVARRMLKLCGWVTTERGTNLPRLGRHGGPTAVPCFRRWELLLQQSQARSEACGFLILNKKEDCFILKVKVTLLKVVFC